MNKYVNWIFGVSYNYVKCEQIPCTQNIQKICRIRGITQMKDQQSL